MLRDSTNDDEGVVSVLKNGAGKVVDKRVEKQPLTGGQEEKLLENVSDNVKKEGGEGVPLAEPPLALNPPAWDAIKKDSGLAGVVEHFNPSSPEIREALSKKDPVEGLPTNGVKSFLKVKFENSGRGRAPVARLDNVSGVDKVFCKATTRNKTSLVRVDKEGDEGAKSKGEAFGVNLEATVLERDGAEVVRSIGANFFGEKDDMGFVNGAEIGGKRVEIT
jgi:hypothetical protein